MTEEKDYSKEKELVKRNLKHVPQYQNVDSDDALHNSDMASLSAHNEQYTELLKAYVEDFKKNSLSKNKNKQEIFIITKILFILIPVSAILLMVIILICLSLGIVDVFESLLGLISALTALLGTFITIPKMITKYLFNKKEEENLANIISKIQDYDRQIRGHL